MEEQNNPAVIPVDEEPKKSPLLAWLIALLIITLIVAGVSMFFLSTQDKTSESATKTTATSVPDSSTTSTDISTTSTAIKDLSTQLSKEITAMAEDQKSDEDTTPTGL